jgi:hypothetical protein
MGANYGSQSLGSEQLCTIRGLVIDDEGARFADASVVIQGTTTRHATQTNQVGEYEFHVPAGLYRITCLASDWHYPFRRATILAQSGRTKTVNIRPPIEVLVMGIERTTSGLKDLTKLAPPPQYAVYFPRSYKKTGLDVMIQSRQKFDNKSYVDYEQVMLSYDSVTLLAKKVRIHKKSLLVEAEGKVIFEDGDRIITGEQMRLDINSRTLNSTVSF